MFSKKWLVGLALTGAIFCATSALAATVTVNSKGTAQTREMARANALKEAIMQVTGVSVDAEHLQHIASKRVSNDTSTKTKTASYSEQLLREKINGVVTGFRIIDESTTPNGMISMSLEVDIEKYDIPGVESNRRSISVQAFEAKGQGTCFGRPITRDEQVKAITEAIQTALVTTRKFAILDRHGNGYDAEKKFIQGDDVRLAEKAKLGLNRGADFVVSGNIRHMSIGETRHKLQMTNRTQIDRHARADVNFNVMMFATREIQLSGNVAVKLTEDISELSCNEIVARLSQKAASEVARRATLSIFPPTVINTAGRMIYFNYGGDEIRAGEVYNLFSKGEPIYDPYTKEPLGNVEELMGQVKVVEVKPKYSVATWVDSEMRAPVKEGDILRPYVAPKPTTATTPKQSLTSKAKAEW